METQSKRTTFDPQEIDAIMDRIAARRGIDRQEVLQRIADRKKKASE